ncbi:hypothetical protein QBC37DRAFT_463532 [Rhypophila decipiens]|uniref:Uncharacterized protein n=1 Tax=Rhypophila decipiens TaxID=261697 RepID=A0AAN6Y7W9_9PEZI|nr:hypothetical protein QBC37DRAFT_463532 [Rhypophila decipiens]
MRSPVLWLLCLVLGVLAVDVPLALDGALLDATADDDTYNTGGHIFVNGWDVIVPKNLLVTFPAAFVPWREFVANKSAVLGFEVNVVGNQVDGVALAAQIFVDEFALEYNQGHIESINYDGTIKIVNGPNIRLNDPNAVFSAGYSYPFMVVDDVNPSVTSFSGFPMCVQRSANDTLCPMSNRPMNAGGSNVPRRIFQAPNPLIMSPLLVGDFIQYRGFWNRQTNELVCFEVVAMNVQITTTGSITYIRVEHGQIGVYTADTGIEIQETRFVTFVSNPSVTVSINAIDLDPCTGHESNRAVGVAQFRPEGGGRNKFLFRTDGTTPIKYTREYRAIASTGQFTTQNGLPGGQYAIPMMEWIQPEQIVPGQEPPIHYFDDMNHLVNGIGPDEDGNWFGPLDPFPQTGVTTFDVTTCPEVVPSNPEDPEAKITGKIRISASTSTTSVNNDLYVRKEDTFILSGSQLNPSEVFGGNDLSWAWSIVNSESVGTVANLNTFTFSADNKTATVKFSNPAPVGDYLFRLTLTSASQNKTATADFNVILFSGADQVTIQSVTWSSTQSGTLGVTCKSNYLYDSKVGMMVTYPGDDGATTSVMAATPPYTGGWAFSARRVDRPGAITCQSLLGGFAQRSGTTTKKKRDFNA